MQNLALENKRVLLIGCGDIGHRLAQLLIASGATVTGLRRSSGASSAEFEMLTADVCIPASLEQLSARRFDYVCLSLTPGESSEAAYDRVYVQGLKNVLAALPSCRHLFWVSSTSVYGQENDEWLDESSETLPKGFSGRKQLEAEAVLADSGRDYTVIRFGGIYGPGRHRLIQQVEAGVATSPSKSQYSNRIHVDDCAGIIHHLMARREEQDIARLYLGVDCVPSQLLEVKNWLAMRLGLQGHWQQTKASKGRGGSKRCSNQGILNSGYVFKYPDFKAGYEAVLKHYD